LTEQVIDTAGRLVNLTTRSLLEYPLDVVMVGGSFGIMSLEESEKFWSIEASYYTNLNDPKKSMFDSDWLTLENNFGETLVSYTHSNAEMSTTLINIEATRELFSSGNARIAILAGFRHQKIEQRIIGYNGYFVNDPYNPSTTQQDVTYDDDALYYRVVYKGPQLGALTRIDLTDNIQLDLKTAGSLTWVNDFDDHYLRNFHTFADGHGLGFISNLNVRWFWNRQFGGHATFIDFMGSFDYYESNISDTREQYQYSPFEAPAGYTTGGLPHDIKSKQVRLGLRFGMVL
ncbi:MAG TPA: omptin family outer membrane protease, partial [candidate division Zixibacteria bacterium]|nr:omptin family outer membrane protease [candidate division Zixibacteria bacterium]